MHVLTNRFPFLQNSIRRSQRRSRAGSQSSITSRNSQFSLQNVTWEASKTNLYGITELWVGICYPNTVSPVRGTVNKQFETSETARRAVPQVYWWSSSLRATELSWFLSFQIFIYAQFQLNVNLYSIASLFTFNFSRKLTITARKPDCFRWLKNTFSTKFSLRSLKMTGLKFCRPSAPFWRKELGEGEGEGEVLCCWILAIVEALGCLQSLINRKDVLALERFQLPRNKFS